MTIGEARRKYNAAGEVYDREFREGRIPSGKIVREYALAHAELETAIADSGWVDGRYPNCPLLSGGGQ